MIQDDGNLFAVSGHPRAAWVTYLGLLAMGHRAAGGIGLLASEGTGLQGWWARRQELGPDAALVLDTLPGSLALGRLSAGPTEGFERRPLEPVRRWWHRGQLGCATAGRLTNGVALRKHLFEDQGSLASDTDAELITSLVARGRGSNVVSSTVHALFDLTGAFNLIVATPTQLVVCRDPCGFRPLFFGRVDGAPAVASESVALLEVGATELREVEPGEVLVIEGAQVATLHPFLRGERRRMASLVDLVALARPESTVAGEQAAEIRAALGRALALHAPSPEAATVVGVQGGLAAAQGYAQALGRPFTGMIAPFVEGGQSPLPPIELHGRGPVSGYRLEGPASAAVTLVVPALAQAASVRPYIQALRRAGAGAIHLRIASPPIVASEPYGLALPPPEGLFAQRFRALDEQARALSVDSVGWLSLDALRASVPSFEQGWCDTIWSGELPIPAHAPEAQLALTFSGSDASDTES
ncbi:MAG: hypothetical protein EA397_13370 [Deltaproteobacteria bacterium]|nr:MAG: hypothetical protein EA397_13370 [Deltaproteobacteria bacterium]